MAVYINENINTVLDGNKVQNSSGDGIQFRNGTTAGVIINNIITTNAGNGIFLSGAASHNLVTLNYLANNGTNILDDGSNTVVNNISF